MKSVLEFISHFDLNIFTGTGLWALLPPVNSKNVAEDTRHTPTQMSAPLPALSPSHSPLGTWPGKVVFVGHLCITGSHQSKPQVSGFLQVLTVAFGSSLPNMIPERKTVNILDSSEPREGILLQELGIPTLSFTTRRNVQNSPNHLGVFSAHVKDSGR